jgi:hypothetical protein
MQLVKGREEVVRELYLRQGSITLGGQADSKADNTLFGQRRIENTLRAKPVIQTHSATKDAAEGYIFTENDGFGVGLEDSS